MDLQKLKTIGLTEGEIKVYSVLLYHGSSNITVIHQKTGLQRRGIYDIINRLIEKGLISYSVENKKRLFSCTPLDKIKQKTQSRMDELKELMNLVPQLKELKDSVIPGVKFETYRGKEGMKAIFEEMLNYKDIYAIAGGFNIVKELPYFWPNYNKRRIKKGVTWHNLIRWELKDKIPEKKLMKIRVLPKDFSKNPIVIAIYGSKVVHLYWLEGFFAFILDSHQMAENYLQYHKFLWNNIAERI